MSRITRHTLVPLAALVLAAGCGRRGAAADAGGPTIRELSRVTLQETAGVYVARPGGVAVDGQGRVLLTDYFQKWIVEFDRSGRFVARYGAPGQGPGEFNAIGKPTNVLTIPIERNAQRSSACQAISAASWPPVTAIPTTSSTRRPTPRRAT